MERCYSYIRHCYAGDCKACSLFVESVCDGKVCLLYYRIMKKLPIRTETSTASNSDFIFSFRIIHRRKGLQQHPSYRTGTVRARTRIAIDGNRIKPKLQAIQSFVADEWVKIPKIDELGLSRLIARALHVIQTFQL